MRSRVRLRNPRSRLSGRQLAPQSRQELSPFVRFENDGRLTYVFGVFSDHPGLAEALDEAESSSFHVRDDRAVPLGFGHPVVGHRHDWSAVRLEGFEVDGEVRPPSWAEGKVLQPICGIARPSSFRHVLARSGAQVLPGLALGNHRTLAPGQRPEAPAGGWLVATEKDRDRLPVLERLVIARTRLEVVPRPSGWGGP